MRRPNRVLRKPLPKRQLTRPKEPRAIRDIERREMIVQEDQESVDWLWKKKRF
jgi:hypothetical protein